MTSAVHQAGPPGPRYSAHDPPAPPWASIFTIMLTLIVPLARAHRRADPHVRVQPARRPDASPLILRARLGHAPRRTRGFSTARSSRCTSPGDRANARALREEAPREGGLALAKGPCHPESVAAPEVRELVLQALERIFRRRTSDDVVHEPAGKSVRRDRPRAPSQGFDLVVAAGGDGPWSPPSSTASRACPARHHPDGNGEPGRARAQHPPVPREAAGLIAARRRRWRTIDAMRIGARMYVLVAGIGISASVAGGTTRNKRRPLARRLSRAAISRYSNRAPAHRGRRRRRSWKHHGRGRDPELRDTRPTALPKVPDIRVDDGHLDVWILDTKTLLDYPRYLFRIVARRPGIPAYVSSRPRKASRSGAPSRFRCRPTATSSARRRSKSRSSGRGQVLRAGKARRGAGTQLAREIFLAKYLPVRRGTFRDLPRIPL